MRKTIASVTACLMLAGLALQAQAPADKPAGHDAMPQPGQGFRDVGRRQDQISPDRRPR